MIKSCTCIYTFCTTHTASLQALIRSAVHEYISGGIVYCTISSHNTDRHLINISWCSLGRLDDLIPIDLVFQKKCDKPTLSYITEVMQVVFPRNLVHIGII